jgi:hypothetical protein
MAADNGRAISLKAQKISKIMDSKIIFWRSAALPPQSSTCTSSFPRDIPHKIAWIFALEALFPCNTFLQ